MTKARKADLMWDITAIVQVILIAVMIVIFLTDPNGFAMDKTITENTPCKYEGGEIVYYFFRGKMTKFTSAATSAAFILFTASEIISVISVILSGRKKYRKIIRIILDIVNGFVLVTVLCMICIYYDDAYSVYHPYEDTVGFYEYRSGDRRIVICEDWFLTSGNAYVYVIDKDNSAKKEAWFLLDDDSSYDVRWNKNGAEITFNDSNENDIFVEIPGEDSE